MRRRDFYALVSAMWVCLAVEATAETVEREQIRYLSPRHAQCLVAAQLAKPWLETLPRSQAEKDFIHRSSFRIHSCFGISSSNGNYSKLSYDYDEIRAGLVREVLIQNAARLPTVYPEPVADGHQSIADEPPALAEERVSWRIREVATCLVKRDWQSATGLIRAIDPNYRRVNSTFDDEAKRERTRVDPLIDRLVALLPGCVPSGTSFRLSRIQLRNFVQEAVYQASSGAWTG